VAARAADGGWGVANCFTNPSAPDTVVCRVKSPMPDRIAQDPVAFGILVRLLSSPDRSSENSNGLLRRCDAKLAFKHSFTTNFIKPLTRAR
jgi:hypothetical protein